MLNTKQKRVVTIDVQTDIENEIANATERAIEGVTKELSEKFLRNISVEFTVTVK